MRLFVAVVLAGALLAGCGSEVEKAEEKAGSEEAAVTQVPPRSEVAETAPKMKTAANWKRPTYEVRDVRPVTITSTDLSAGNADVFLTASAADHTAIMKYYPVLQEIADEIRADNPEYEMMLVSVYSGTEKREDRFMSNWYAFEQGFLADFENYADKVVQESKDKQAQQNANKNANK